MSANIFVWAKKQKTGSPSAKAVLMALADAASNKGQCWPSQQTLAEETEQSVDSIQRRLADLERRGLIYVFKARRWDDSGRWRVNMIVVLADSYCISFAEQHGYDPSDHAAAGERENGEENPDVGAATAPQIAERPPLDSNKNKDLHIGEGAPYAADCGMDERGEKNATVPHGCGADRTALVRYRTITSEPYSPKSPPEPSSSPALEDGSWQADWKRFEDLWPWTGDEARDRVKRKFRDLAPDARTDLLAAAEAYLADRRQRNGKICSARAFISDGIFKNWTRAGRDLAARGGDRRIGDPVFVRMGSEAWDAWKRAKGGKSMPTVRKIVEGRSVDGWFFPTLFPPPGPEPNAGSDLDGLTF